MLAFRTVRSGFLRLVTATLLVYALVLGAIDGAVARGAMVAQAPDLICLNALGKGDKPEDIGVARHCDDCIAATARLDAPPLPSTISAVLTPINGAKGTTLVGRRDHGLAEAGIAARPSAPRGPPA